MGRRSFTALAALAMLLLGLPLAPMTAMAAGSSSVVISQVYGGGGNTGATYQNDFVELFNRGTTTVSLAGWSIQYASATGTGTFGSATNLITPLSGSLAPGQYLLVQEASTAAVGAPLPTPDITDSTPINMSGTGGKVALVNTTTPLGCNGGSTPCSAAALATIVDLVGYDGATFFEGSAAAPTLSSTTAALRAAGGCTDTDNNAADFTAPVPAPRNSLSPLHPCQAPSVISSTPPNGASNVATNAVFNIVFSESVTVSANWFGIACTNSGVHAVTTTGAANAWTATPTTPFAQGEQCTATIAKDEITSASGAHMLANYVITFTTALAFSCGDPKTAIHAIQGAGATSPMVGTKVDIEGVVDGSFESTGSFGGFYVQEADSDADADPATSEGIFVLSTATAVNAGDRVRVRGNVTEFVTSGGGVTSSLTELGSVTNVIVCSTGNSVSPTVVTLPVASLSDFERYEGMLVRFTQDLTATETFTLGRFGEVRLAANGRLFTPTAVVAPGAPAIALDQANDRRSFVLDDGNNSQNIDPTAQGYYPTGTLSASNTLRSGYVVHGGLTGVFDERFGAYRVQALGPIAFDASTNPRTAGPDPVGGTLKIGSANVLNFFNGDGLGGGFPTSRGANTAFELGRQEAKIVSELAAIGADVYGLMEIENDSGPNSAIAELTASLNAVVGAGTYSFVDTGVIGTDAIKVALLYKPSVVTPIGPWKILTTAIDPRFIDTKNRPSLAQTFQRNGTGMKVTVVVNHLKSKGSTCTDVGDPDIGDGQGNCNVTRTQAAAALVDWLNTDPTGSGSQDFLLIGDMNSYAKEDPITRFVSGGYTDLVALFEGAGAYSYVFDGAAGYIDHALASPALLSKVTGVGHWHNNADEPIVLDYNTEFKTASQVTSFYSSGPYRASDHDPVVVGLQLLDTTPPTIVAPADLVTFTGVGSATSTVFLSDVDLGVATATDDAPGTITITRTGVPAGNLFPIGTTTLTYTATDASGNTATATQKVTVVDDTRPTISGTTTTSANAHGWWNGPVTVHFTCFDNSGSVTCPSDVTLTAEGAAQSVTGTATDPSGNTASATVSGINIDGTAPTIALSGSTTYTIDQIVSITCLASDTLSGIDTATCPSASGPAFTFGVGPHTLNASATDNAGNTTTVSTTFTVTSSTSTLCTLVRALVTNTGEQTSLCAKLTAAAEAAARGNTRAHDGQIGAFINEVNAQRGKAISDADASALIALAGAL